MIVILDTNILRKDFLLKTTDFYVLMQNPKSIIESIVIPEVVLDEIVTLYGEELQAAIKSRNEKHRSISKLLIGDKLENLPQTDIKNEISRYREYLDEMFKMPLGSIYPYPEICHREVVARELSRKKPFKKDGSGYRDFLIWQTVKAIAQRRPGEVVFITANSSDFGIAPKLNSDFSIELNSESDIRLYNSLGSFLEMEIYPSLEVPQNALKDADPYQERIASISSDVSSMIYDIELGAICMGFPKGAGQVSAGTMTRLIESKVIESYQIEPDEKYYRVSIRGRFNLHISVSWNDFNNYKEIRDWVGPEDDGSPFSSISTSSEEELTVVIEAVFNLDSKFPISKNVISISGDYGDIDFS